MNEELDIEHILREDGRCVISINGQGHLPCKEHSENVEES